MPVQLIKDTKVVMPVPLACANVHLVVPGSRPAKPTPRPCPDPADAIQEHPVLCRRPHTLRPAAAFGRSLASYPGSRSLACFEEKCWSARRRLLGPTSLVYTLSTAHSLLPPPPTRHH